MADVTRQCIDIMGSLSFDLNKFALVGMGSLARNEVTPYSDFKHFIILDVHNETEEHLNNCKEYFRWFTVIFNVVIINLQETDLYTSWIPCLTNSLKKSGYWFYDKITPSGISFDRMKPYACHFPLGNVSKRDGELGTPELIRTVDGMVKYLEPTQKKHKLGDLLTSTCFVAGD